MMNWPHNPGKFADRMSVKELGLQRIMTWRRGLILLLALGNKLSLFISILRHSQMLWTRVWDEGLMVGVGGDEGYLRTDLEQR